jgi:hypothetical protein
MVDESIHNNSQYLKEERFVRLEAQFINIKHNMNLLMVSLERNIILFTDDGTQRLDQRGNQEIRKTQKRSHGKNPRKSSQV